MHDKTVGAVVSKPLIDGWSCDGLYYEDPSTAAKGDYSDTGEYPHSPCNTTVH